MPVAVTHNELGADTLLLRAERVASVLAPDGNGSDAVLTGWVDWKNVPVTATEPVTETAPEQVALTVPDTGTGEARS
jgi:hypothetical protein